MKILRSSFFVFVLVFSPLAVAESSFELVRVFDPAGTREVALRCVESDFCQIEVISQGNKRTKQIDKAVGLKWLKHFASVALPVRRAPSMQRRLAGAMTLLSWNLELEARREQDKVFTSEVYEELRPRRKRMITALLDLEERLLKELELE